MKTRKLDVVIIGGSQAGLAMGKALEKLLCGYVIIDKHSRISDAWRQRYDSLVLFTSRQYCQLEGMSMPGIQDDYPTKDEMADYLETYAKHFELPVKTNCTVTSLSRKAESFTVKLNNDEQIICKAVIIASGGFQDPLIRLASKEDDSFIPQLTVNNYRNSTNLPKGAVLIVGDGASGRQIALDACKTHPVILSTGKKRNIIPQRLLNKDIFWWLDKVGILSAKTRNPIAKLVRKRDPFPGKHLNLKKLSEKGIKIADRLTAIKDGMAQFANGDKEPISSIVWASGYQNNTSWVDIEEAVNGNEFIHKNGVSPVAGIFYLGLPWQNCRASALITGLQRDSQFIAQHVGSHLSRVTPSNATTEPVIF